MSQLQLYKGLISEYNEKKNKIANGGLVITKKENNSSVGNLYINDDGTHVQLSSDAAVINVVKSEEDNKLIVSKINGESNVVLTVDNTLLEDSSNPVENKAIYTKFELQDTDIEENVKTPLNTLIGNDKGQSVRDISIDVLTEQLVSDTAQESLDTLKEIADWIQKHPQDAAAMNTAIQNNADEIDDIQLDIMRLDVQPDWELNNNQSHAYIQNKPMVKKGAKSTSIAIGDSIANGEYSLAGGTNDSTLIKNLTGTSVTVDKPTTHGPMSLSFGAGTEAYTAGTLALGVLSTAGCKGFYWWKIDFTTSGGPTITLSTNQRASQYDLLAGTRKFDSAAQNALSNWAQGDKISITNGIKYSWQSKIVSVNSSAGTVQVDSLPFTEDDLTFPTSLTGLAFDDYQVFVVSKPTAGIVDFALGSVAIGGQNVAGGSFSLASGFQTTTISDFAHTEGRETIANYAAHSEGYLTQALGR